MGFVLVGINPRLPYDTDYQHFMQLLCRQLATSMASIVLVEDELRRSRMAADTAIRDRLQLSRQLAEVAMQAQDSVEDNLDNSLWYDYEQPDLSTWRCSESKVGGICVIA